MIEYTIKLHRKTKTLLRDRWVWRMAWRDARHNFSRLFLFTASLVTGIAAVLALDSMNKSLQSEIENNARELLGADLVINADKKIDKEVLDFIDSLRYPVASEAEMASMVTFLGSGQSRLIKLVAVEGPFPFYGSVTTTPEGIFPQLGTGSVAVLDESLASQYGVSTGDSLRLGGRVFTVLGAVSEIPGGGGLTSTFTPAVYISLGELDSTRLVQYGSRVSYKKYLKIEKDEEVTAVVNKIRPLLKKHGYGEDTVEEQKEDLGRAFQSVYRFFSLLAFLALILGCIGVASSVHIYAREKRDEVAVLRCVGSSGWQAFNIYFIQIFVLGLIGSVIGAALGVAIQQLIPVFLKGVIPFEVAFGISWSSLLIGLVLGTLVALLFSALPLINVRFVPPLTVLRSGFERVSKFSRARVLVIALIVLFPMAFATWQTGQWQTGIAFTLGLLLALGLLALVAALLLILVRKFFPHRSAFVWRHAMSNLFRPNNQTGVLMVSIGLGAFIISTLNITEQSMLAQLEFTGQENQSNTILFDIQPSQKEGVVALMKSNNLKINQVVPIVTCRLSEVKGRAVSAIQADTSDRTRNWALTREYRVTYRDSLTHSETLTKGELHRLEAGRDSVWVTISEGMQENLNVDIGDSLVFDVQGFPIKARISGIRTVEWPKDPPNFIFVFPTGVLEQAPQIYVTATRVEDQVLANKFQRELVASFPNVSLIDLRLILSTVNSLFDKLGAIVRFLALFSIATGLVVLAGAVINSKYIRMKENVLLRTLGARKRQISMITLIEYGYLGIFSALTGLVLSLGGGWLLTRFFFEITFAFDWLEMSLIFVGVVVLSVFIGWWNSRSVLDTPPLQVLRKEV